MSTGTLGSGLPIARFLGSGAGYSGRRFPLVFGNPFRNAEPMGTLNDFGSMGYAATFDEDDNLYIADLNRARVLIYRRPLSEPAAE